MMFDTSHLGRYLLFEIIVEQATVLYINFIGYLTQFLEKPQRNKSTVADTC